MLRLNLLLLISLSQEHDVRRKYVPMSISQQSLICNVFSHGVLNDPWYLSRDVSKASSPFGVSLCHVALKTQEGFSICAKMVTSSPT